MTENKNQGSLSQAFLWPLLIVIAAFLWGLDGVLLRPALYTLSPAVVVFLEHAIAFTIMLFVVLVSFLYKRGQLPKVFKKDWQAIKILSNKGWLVMFWVALFGGLIGTLTITKALFFVGFIPLSIPILIQKTQPLFAVLFAKILLDEKMKKIFYFWMGVALFGSYLVTFGFQKPILNLDNKAFVAGLLGLAAAFAWGSSTSFGRKAVIKELTYRSAVFLRFGLTTVLTLILLVLGTELNSIVKVSPDQIKVLLIVALSTGLTASFLYYKGLKKVSAHLATLCELAFPVTVVVGDYLLHDKIMSLSQFLGAGLILVAVIKSKNLSLKGTQLESKN